MNDFAPGALRQAWLTGSYDLTPPSCPGCGTAGVLGLLQPGRPSTVPGLEDRPDMWGCVACGWTGSSVAPTLDSEIRACWLEQQHMDVAGSGGGSKGRARAPKPGDKERSHRVEQDAMAGGPERCSTVERYDKRSSIRSFRLTVGCDALVQREMGARSCTFQSLADEAFGDWALRLLTCPT